MLLLVLAVAAGLVGACSSDAEPEEASDPRSIAEGMINGEMATIVGLGPLVGLCGDLGPLVVGSTFGCTATTEAGDVIQIRGEVNPDGRLELTTTNLVADTSLPSFEREAAAALNTSVGSNFTAEAVDCGGGAVVLPSDFTMQCALIMPSSGQIFDLTLTITDLDGRRFSLVVADEPRS